MRHYSELKGEALGFLFLLWVLWFLNVSGRLIFSPLLPLIEDEFMLTHARVTSIFYLSINRTCFRDDRLRFVRGESWF